MVLGGSNLFYWYSVIADLFRRPVFVQKFYHYTWIFVDTKLEGSICPWGGLSARSYLSGVEQDKISGALLAEHLSDNEFLSALTKNVGRFVSSARP